MSDVAQVLHENELALRPEEITIEERFNVRRFAESSEKELKKLDLLSRVIERDGQTDPAVAIVNDTGGYTLICGHRRRRAIIIANERRAAAGQSLLRVRVAIDKSGRDPKRIARLSNIQRENLSPMQLATTIKEVKEENNWIGFPGSKKVAEYLGIDTATVTQHERFLTADKETQNQLHSGELTPQGAFTMLNVPEEKRAEVFGKAREKQKELDSRKQWADDNGAKKGEMKTKLANGVEVPVIEPKKAAKQPDKLTQPAIVAAIRETPNATVKDVPRTRKEVIEFFMSLDGPAYGFANGAVRQFVDYFCNSFCPGRGTEATLLKKFDAMTAGADQGTESKKDTQPAEEKKTASGKLKRVDAGVKKTEEEKSAAKEKAAKTPKPATKKAGKKPVKKALKKKAAAKG